MILRACETRNLKDGRNILSTVGVGVQAINDVVLSLFSVFCLLEKFEKISVFLHCRV